MMAHAGRNDTPAALHWHGGFHLATNRLWLRAVTATEADDLIHGATITGIQFPADYRVMSQSLHRLARGMAPATFLVLQRPSGLVIGEIGIQIKARQPDEAWISLEITQAERGKGFATEALERIAQWCHEQPGVHRIRGSIADDNDASKRMARAAGFCATSSDPTIWEWHSPAEGGAEA